MEQSLCKETILLFLLLLFLSFFSLFAVNSNALLILLVFILIISIWSIIKKKENVSKNDIIVAIILMIVCLPTNPILGIFVLPTYIASRCILKNTNDKIVFWGSAKNLMKTFLCIVIVGGFLSVVNLLLMGATINMSFDNIIQYLLSSLGIGIYEEVIFRMFYFALCMLILKEKKMNKIQHFLTYFIMILPHVLLHPNIDFVSIVVLSLLFGLPFALMQRKINLFSAIGSHSFVDFIRFIVVGA